MPVPDERPLHDFTDRAIRQTLTHRENLRAFLSAALPEHADHFVYERAHPITRDFPLDDWRYRECDLIFEIPYRTSAGERPSLVCVLIEHQSAPDVRMPLRLLYYAVAQWEKCWKAYDERDAPRGDFTLPPVVPLVLYTGHRPWNTARTLADLLSGPEVLHSFAPRWEPLF